MIIIHIPSPRLLSNYHSLCIQNVIPAQNSHTFLFCSSLSASSPPPIAPDFKKSIALSRRLLFRFTIHVPVFLWNPFSSSLSMATTNEVLSLQKYTDSKEGFTLLKPASWIQVNYQAWCVIFFIFMIWYEV